MKKIAFKILSLIFILFFVCSALLLLSERSFAKADEDAKQVSLVSPAMQIEYSEITNPSFISYANNKIFLTNDSKKFFIFDLESNTILEYIAEDLLDNPVKAIYNQQMEKVIVQYGETLFTYDLSSGVRSNLKYGASNLTVTSFDICNNQIIMLSAEHFLRSFSNNMRNDLTEWKGSDITICSDKTNIFFSNISGIDVYNLETRELTKENFLSFIPTHMASNGEYLYYVIDNNVYKKSLENGETTPLSATSEFTLGNLGTIKSICLKGENLLIASTFSNGNSAIQEFEVKENKLVFTGFAISKGNSAFNRINADAIDIEKNGNKIAVIDSQKVTLITKTNDIRSYQNILLENDLAGVNKIALGKDRILLATDNGYYFFNLKNLELLKKGSFENIADLIFANNNFYVVSNNKVYIYNGNEFIENEQQPQDMANSFTIDVNGKIVSSESLKVLTDLAGTKFELDDSGKLNGYSLQGYSQKIKSFAMDIESNEIYFLIENEELILSSTAFNNKALSQIAVESDYKTTDGNAENIENLSVYTINDNSNVYSIFIDIENNITYNGLTKDFKGEFICIYKLNAPFNNFYILAGYDVNNIEMLVLVNKENLTEKQVAKHIEKRETFVATSVDMYYLPLINSKNRDFALKNGEIMRLNGGEKITYENEVVFNGKTFLYGEVEINGKNVKGYVPKDFTAETLSSNNNIQIIERETVQEKGNNLKIIVCLFLLSMIVFVTTIYFVFIRKHDSF